MKKFLIGLIFILLIVCMLPLSNTVSYAQGNETIKIWFSHKEVENEKLREIASKFTDETGINVEVVSRRSIFDAPSDLVNYATLDDSPDIIFMQAPDIGSLVASGYLKEMEFDENTRSSFVDTAFDAFTIEGKCYGVGYSVDTSGILYNKDLISEKDLPETWDEFFEIGEGLTIKNNEGKITQRGILLNSRDMWFNYPIIREYGGYYYGQYNDGTYNPYDIGLDNAGMLDYVDKIKELQEKDLVLSSQIAGERTILSEFANGRLAMMLYGLWSANILQSRGINYGIAKLPVHSNGEASLPLTTVQGFVINKYTNHSESADLFLQYVLKDENQQALIEAGNSNEQKTGERNPSNISVINSNYIQEDEILKNLSAIGSECEPFPNIPEGTIWYNYTTTIFRTIFFGDSDGNEVDPQEKLTELADTIRNDVALMNITAERIEIEWWVYLIVGLSILVILAIIILFRKRKNKKNPLYVKYECSKKITLLSWGLMLPLIILLLIFYVYPIIHNIYLSLTDYSGINLRDYGIIGFANYKDIFTTGIDGLISMTVWTIFYAISVVSLSFLLGTLVATILDKVNIKIAKIYRVIFILPWVIPTVITILMWKGLLTTDGGLINQILNVIGIPSVPWLDKPVCARISTILVMVWFSFPYFMVIAFGLLKSIPKDYYEAARIDGANKSYIFFRITLPLIFQALIPTLIMSFIMQFNQFGVYLLTQGGPPSDVLGAPGATDLLITYVFNKAFNTNRYAVAAAYSVIIFVFVGIFSLIAMGISKKRQTE